jgi:hypothetical protein
MYIDICRYTVKNWATQFLTLATMVHVPVLFLSEWREFPSAPCLAGKKNLITAGISMLLKSRFLSASVTRKDLQFGT